MTRIINKIFFTLIILLLTSNFSIARELIWPINCIPGKTCDAFIGYPDIDKDGKAFNCKTPGYKAHEGTDIAISNQQMMKGVDVYAATDGIVLWVFDGKYDRCPDPNQPDCKNYQVCTPKGNFCGKGTCCCWWCFNGGNMVVIRHTLSGVFATVYCHMRKNSIVVKPGQVVRQGQKIGLVGSSGKSTGPHLHFEVWGTGFYELADPWAGDCGPNYNHPLWKFDPPWKSLTSPNKSYY